MARKPWEHVAWILLEILKSPSLSVTRKHIEKELNLSRAQFYKVIGQLIKGTDETPPLLEEIPALDESDKKNILYKLKCGWSELAGASLESKFFLECYKHVGYLLDTDYNQVQHDMEDPNIKPAMLKKLPKKFFYLSKTQAQPFAKAQRDHLNMIVHALLNEQELFLFYPKYDEVKSKTPRRVKPLTLCQYRDDLYLLGIEGEEREISKSNVKCYKISRIANVIGSKEKFQYPATWNPGERYKHTSGLIIGPENKALVRVYGPFIMILREKNFMNAKETSSDGESVVYEFTYTDTNEFLGQLAVYCECVEILAPAALQQQFMQKLAKGLARNSAKKLAA
ncbi:MAG: WYL domain-containing protein [Bdellovibrio sp.]|nr:WYL domain-containing protein [Bdellovibrio sp.]